MNLPQLKYVLNACMMQGVLRWHRHVICDICVNSMLWWWWWECVRHKYLWLGRPERKPISFYRNKEAVNTFHLPSLSLFPFHFSLFPLSFPLLTFHFSLFLFTLPFFPFFTFHLPPFSLLTFSCEGKLVCSYLLPSSIYKLFFIWREDI